MASVVRDAKACLAPTSNCPYTHNRGYATFKLPTIGDPKEAVKFQIKNPTAQRVTWKVGGTKLDKFLIIPQYGYAEPVSMSPVIDLQPKKIAAGELVSYEDKFVIEIAPAPPNAPDNAKSLWKGAAAPQGASVLHLDIKLAGDKDEVKPKY